MKSPSQTRFLSATSLKVAEVAIHGGDTPHARVLFDTYPLKALKNGWGGGWN